MMLTVKNLSVEVKATKQRIVDSVSFDVGESEIVALVGGSGSGKSTTAFSILRLLSPALEIVEGQVIFQYQNLSALSMKQMPAIRAKKIGLVFQDPLNAFNPLFTIGNQIDEVLKIHLKLSKQERQERILSLLNQVGIDDASRIANSYPHQLSGGLRQRAMIAQAIAAEPKFLIADEPTSNLDVTLQAKIIELFRKLREETGLSILLITHELGMAEHLADRIVVMNQGQVVEQGKTSQIIQNPQHVYTQQLLKAC